MRLFQVCAACLFLFQISCTLSANISGMGSLNGSHSKGDLNSDDQTPPELTITSPVANTLIDSSHVNSGVVVGTCSENGSTVTMEVYYTPSDSTPAATFSDVCTQGNVSFGPDLSSVNDAELYVYLKQTDSAGNIGKSSPTKITKKANAPTVFFLSSPALNVITGPV